MPKILLVEDEESWQTILMEDLTQALKEIGYLKNSIELAKTFDEAARKLNRTSDWDLMIADIALSSTSEMLGKRLVVKAQELVIPTIVISGKVSPQDVRHFFKVNKVLDFFSKSNYYARTNEFVTIVQEVLKDKNQNQELASVLHQESINNLQTNQLTWLHLTDIHIGMKEQSWLFPGIKSIFLEDLKSLHEKCGDWDLVLFTGDLTQRGTKEQFEQVDRFLQELWSYFAELGCHPKLLAVPGNHDLVRPNPKNPTVRLLQKWSDEPEVQTEFWEEFDSPYRQVVADAFENYCRWWENQTLKPENLKMGMLPGDFSVTIEKEGVKFGIVGLNSSFLQLTNIDYEGKLGLHTRQFQAVCEGDGPTWTKKHNACLLLTHHPPRWLNSNAQQHLLGEIAVHGHFEAHLCGHLHETSYQEQAQAGTQIQRLWQGRSLFGLEYFSRADQEFQRLHGYTVGRIELSEKGGQLIFWPREARLHGNQRSIVPDYSMELTDEQHTKPRNF